MKNYLLFAPDDRAYLDLVNIVLELKKRNLPFFFLYSRSPMTQHPRQSLEQYQYDTNIEDLKPHIQSASLGNCSLPFIPDILFITREDWEPDTTVIKEFKQTGTIICCVENSAWPYNNIKTRLEIKSRLKYPTNMIDVFFEQSQWSLDTKIQAGWVNNKSHIVGIPKYDILPTLDPDIIYKKYPEINNGKPKIIVYGSMEKNLHYGIVDKLENKTNISEDRKAELDAVAKRLGMTN